MSNGKEEVANSASYFKEPLRICILRPLARKGVCRKFPTLKVSRSLASEVLMGGGIFFLTVRLNYVYGDMGP